MSGRKNYKGADVVCPYWHAETQTTVTCEGWMTGSGVQLRFASEGSKQRYMCRRCKQPKGWRRCLLAAAAGKKYEK